MLVIDLIEAAHWQLLTPVRNWWRVTNRSLEGDTNLVQTKIPIFALGRMDLWYCGMYIARTCRACTVQFRSICQSCVTEGWKNKVWPRISPQSMIRGSNFLKIRPRIKIVQYGQVSRLDLQDLPVTHEAKFQHIRYHTCIRKTQNCLNMSYDILKMIFIKIDPTWIKEGYS